MPHAQSVADNWKRDSSSITRVHHMPSDRHGILAIQRNHSGPALIVQTPCRSTHFAARHVATWSRTLQSKISDSATQLAPTQNDGMSDEAKESAFLTEHLQ
jgi:hypothetical protein